MGSASALAQRDVSLGLYRPAWGSYSFLTVNTPRTPGAWQWDVGLVLDWDYRPLSMTFIGGDEREVVRHRVTAHALAQVGLWERMALGFDLPVIFQDADGEPLQDGLGDMATVAGGDLRMSLRYRFLGPDKILAHEPPEGWDLALQASATLPLGNGRALAGEEAITTTLEALVDFHILGIGVGASLGWTHRFRERQLGTVRLRDALHMGVGVELPTIVIPGLSVLTEVRFAFDPENAFGDEATTPVTLDAGLRYGVGEWTMTATAGGGLTSAIGTPEVRVIAGLNWSPRTPDKDGDGVPDARDGCPLLAEDRDGFEDHDGCLDPDNDMDFLLDEEDRCPNTPVGDDNDANNDGCPD